ncbi:Bug family tripartite tricarboxylate transporter substrate binding protein [Ottowia thiooxydans]|uniref:Bug family tripartite tricarboxylate transporter substrate binding protein n=1 Tax=Ottowia thiooxydans TaxID=219182 RepID=UPI0004125A22|nr:tripartite tricarboxylate transporter substrate binding protein [Ottowia thiooxydans]
MDIPPHFSRRHILSAAALLPLAAKAQPNYPSKPIRMIIPFAAGGATDVLGRDLGQAMAPSLGQSFVVENIGGGAGVPALNSVSRAAPDGYSVLFCASGNITAQPLLSKNRVDILSQVTPVGMIASAAHVLVISDKAPFKSLPELIAYAKAHPGEVNFGSAGIGGLAHLGTELLAHSAGIKVTHVPYKGASAATNDLVAGQIHAIFGTMPSFTAMIEKGALHAIGITAASNAQPLKGVPLISKTVPGFSYSSWNAIFAPARTPAGAIDKLYTSMRAAAQNPGLKHRFDEQGVDVALAGPDELRKIVLRERGVWEKVIRDARVELN